MTFIFIVILLIAAAISDAAMDTIEFHFERSIFSGLKKWDNWFNPAVSWKNKYKNHDPLQGPAFFGSTTFLIWTTDAWHFFQMLMLTSFQVAIILGINYIFFQGFYFWKILLIDIGMLSIAKLLYGTIFEAFWRKIFVKKK